MNNGDFPASHPSFQEGNILCKAPCFRGEVRSWPPLAKVSPNYSPQMVVKNSDFFSVVETGKIHLKQIQDTHCLMSI